MERLTIDEVIKHCNRQTERMENNFGRSQLEEKPMMGNLNIMKHYWEHRQVAKWLKELKEYRDLEEQGRLIKLPYPLGTEKLYFVWDYEIYELNAKEITFYKADKFAIRPYETVISVDSYDFYYDDFGKTVFLTKEKAEKALTEMEK